VNIFQILGLILKYGPSLFSLAWKVYKAIEEYSDRKANDPESDLFDGVKATSQDKRNRFDILMKLKAKDKLKKDLTRDEVAAVREDIHKVKSRKRGKAK